MTHVTLGYEVDDRTVNVIATFNITNLRLIQPELADELESVILNLNHRLQTSLFNRQDTADVINLDED